MLETIASVAGIISAAPPPGNTRAPISNRPVGASPAAREVAVKTVRPQRKIRLLPSASASRPAASTKAASARVQALRPTRGQKLSGLQCDQGEDDDHRQAAGEHEPEAVPRAFAAVFVGAPWPFIVPPSARAARG